MRRQARTPPRPDDALVARGTCEAKSAVLVEADEAGSWAERDVEVAEPPEPGAQERRRFEALGEDASARADEGLFA